MADVRPHVDHQDAEDESRDQREKEPHHTPFLGRPACAEHPESGNDRPTHVLHERLRRLRGAVNPARPPLLRCAPDCPAGEEERENRAHQQIP